MHAGVAGALAALEQPLPPRRSCRCRPQSSSAIRAACLLWRDRPGTWIADAGEEGDVDHATWLAAWLAA